MFPKTPPAGSDSGLRPTQGQSRLWERIRFFPYPFVLRYAKILVEPEVVLRTGRFFSSRTLSWRYQNFGKPKSSLGTHSVLSIYICFKIRQNFGRPKSPLGIDLVAESCTKIFAIAYSYGECIIKSGRHIF